ncbi:flagellar motor switch protein FliN [Pseudoblastomonas halimionae]|uniref:Flagellar motor switch protein FliN n=1 Tax=Alteriqipengyuania halimionae TaxID=1926630 RepID=A0A6I4U3X8_9SPHN|nr:flagellar motor switch protein FliN [Alteriqipengyuania halimionae]MXP10436.1 flagellar motor switch protein FliN [Alteriqipengyuania halimionae]
MTEVGNDVAEAQIEQNSEAFVDLPSLGETAPSDAREGLSINEDHGHELGLDAVHDVPVKMQVVLGRARMTVAELMQVAPGRVVELDRKVGEPVDIFVSNRLIARGEVVLIERALGVTLTEIVHEED